MEEWAGSYEGHRGVMKREIERWKIKCKTLVKRKEFWYVAVPLLLIIVYSLWPATVVYKDNYGLIVENPIHLHVNDLVPYDRVHTMHLRNSSITDRELERGLIRTNYTARGSSMVQEKNLTLNELHTTCTQYYEERPDEPCICLRDFGLLFRGACVNMSGSIEPAMNIVLDRDHWSNKDKEYKVNGRTMEIPDKTLIRFVNHKRKTIISKEQYRNICLIWCHDGRCSEQGK